MYIILLIHTDERDKWWWIGAERQGSMGTDWVWFNDVIVDQSLNWSVVRENNGNAGKCLNYWMAPRIFDDYPCHNKAYFICDYLL